MCPPLSAGLCIDRARPRPPATVNSCAHAAVSRRSARGRNLIGDGASFGEPFGRARPARVLDEFCFRRGSAVHRAVLPDQAAPCSAPSQSLATAPAGSLYIILAASRRFVGDVPVTTVDAQAPANSPFSETVAFGSHHCQRRSDLAAGRRSKSAALTQARRRPNRGLLACRVSFLRGSFRERF